MEVVKCGKTIRCPKKQLNFNMTAYQISTIATAPLLLSLITTVIILQDIRSFAIEPSFTIYRNWRRQPRLYRCYGCAHCAHRKLGSTAIDNRLQIKRHESSVYTAFVKLIESGNRPGMDGVESSIDRDKSDASSSSSDNETISEYFVTEAMFVHLGPAARILTEEFYSHRTNFITFQMERLKTSLSLESTFPKRGGTAQENVLNQPLKQMFVACNREDGTVLGFAEVDAYPSKKSNRVEETNKDSQDSTNNINRPYMYNLAVDKRWKRKGIARALIRECEKFVRNRHIWRTEMIDATFLNAKEDSLCNDSILQLFLKVRKDNIAAISLYESMGYREIDPKSLSLSQEEVNSGSAEEGELAIFAKDLIDQKKNSLAVF